MCGCELETDELENTHKLQLIVAIGISVEPMGPSVLHRMSGKNNTVRAHYPVESCGLPGRRATCGGKLHMVNAEQVHLDLYPPYHTLHNSHMCSKAAAVHVLLSTIRFLKR